MGDFLANLATADSGKFLAVIGIVMWLDIRGTVKSMAKTMETLCINVGVVVERVDSHEKRIDKLEEK